MRRKHSLFHRDQGRRAASRDRESHLAVGNVPDPIPGDHIPLAALRAGQTARISELTGGRGLSGRLACLGFTPGASVTMIQNYGHGPLIVEMRGTRIALGRGEAARILVNARS